MAHVDGAGTVEGFEPSSVLDVTDAGVLAAEPLPDAVLAVGVAVGAGKQRPVGRLADVGVAEIPVGREGGDRVVLVAGLEVGARFGRALGVVQGEPVVDHRGCGAGRGCSGWR